MTDHGNLLEAAECRKAGIKPILGAGLVLLMVLAGAAAAELTLSDQESEVYYRYGVVAGERVQAELDAAITGHLHSNGDVDLKKDSSVMGDVTAVGAVDLRGTVSGVVREGADPLALPELLDEAALAALADRVFEDDVTFTDATIDDVVFVAGTARLRGDVRGVGTVIATRDVRVDTTEGGHFSPLDEASRLSLIAGNDIRLGKDRPFRGVLRAGRDVDLEMGAVFEGVAVADRRVRVKQGARVTFVDFDPVAPEIDLVSPADGSFLPTATPEITVAYSDDFSGLRLDSVVLLLDGVDVTGQAVIDPAGLTFIPEPLADGLHTLEVAVTDHSDNEARETFSFTTDTVPPAVAITAPAQAILFNAVPPIAVDYSDATSGIDLASLRIAVDGVLLSACTVGGSSATCPPPALDEGEHTVTAAVEDAAGNAATTSFTFELVFDVEPPELAVTAPGDPVIFNDATPEIAVAYSDAVSGVDLATLSLTIDGLDLVPGCAVTAATATCEAPELAAGSHTVSAALSDAAGNAATASFTFELVFDTDPPTIALSAPDHVTLRRGGRAVASVEDNVAVAEVVFRLDGVELARFTAPPFEADFQAPEGAQAGDLLSLTVEASDTAGNVASLSHEVRIAADGVVVGQVLSDETGHPLAGVRVWAVGYEDRLALTDADGRYSLPALEPQVVLRIESADGSTLPVERPLSVLPEVGTVAVDSRLRPLAAPVTVGAGGGTVEAEGIALTVAPGALAADTPVRLTPLGPQGLPGLLPRGWSPLFAFDVEGPESFQAPVEATVDALPPEVLHLARYRRPDHLWVMVQPDVAVSGGAAGVALREPGSYALLARDSEAAGDPLPAAGEALPGVEAVPLPPEAVCEGEVEPPVLPPSGGTARGALSLASPIPLPSGTVVRTEVTETFTLVSGTEGSEEVRSQDVVFYRLPAPAGAALGAEIPVVPVRTFDSGELVEARVHVEILSGRISARGRVGGKVPVTVASGSAELSVAADSLAEDTVVSVEPVELSSFVPAVAGLVPLAEVIVDFSGQRLAVPAELSVDGSTAAPGDSFLVARVERIDGVPHVVAVAPAELAAGRAVSGAHPDLPGITRDGRYVVYRASTSFGLVSGVTRSDAGPVRAVVETDVWPFAAVADFDGRYTVAARPGPATLSARVPATSLAGSASVEVVAGQTVFADLLLAGATTSATVSPADGAIGVPVSAQVEIVAAAALARASVTPENVRLFRGPVADALTVAVRLVLSASGRSLGVIPEAGLEPATAYTLVAAGLADVHGGLVAVPTVSFTTAAEEPLEVDTDRLVLTFPDDDGLVRLLAPAGTLAPGTTILIVNTGNGVAVSFTVANDGSVAGEIPATIDDLLQITIVDPLGNVLNFELSRFVAQDGSGRTAVGPGGGLVEGPGGAALRIPAGALDRGAVFQVEPFGPEAFPERPELPGGLFGGGLRVTAPPDLEMRKAGDLVFPKPPEAPDGAFYHVYRRLTGPGGQVGFEVIDHAFVEGQGADARVATASYPFIGWEDSVDSWQAAADGQIVGFGVAAQTHFYLMYTVDALRPGLATQGLITGNVTRAVLAPGATEPVFEPLPGVAVRSDRDTITIARSGADGTYALWDPVYVGGPVEVTASGPAGTLTLTAFEADPDTTRDRQLPIQYRNIAIANFAFPPETPPARVAAFETRVMKLNAAGQREDTGGIVVAGTPLIVGFRFTSSGSRPVIQSATILGETFAVRPDTADDPLRMDFVLDRAFTPPAAGSYTVTAVALPPLGGSPITVAHTFLAVAPGGSNRVPLLGAPPDVISELLDPPDGGSGVPVGVLPTVVFTEPVRNLPGNVQLLDEDDREVAILLSGIGVDAAGDPVIIEDLAAAGAAAAVTSLTVRPVATLRYGTAYRLVLGEGIIDLDETPTGQPDPHPLVDAPRSFTFETFGAEVLGSTDFFPGRGVVAFRERSYAATEDSAGRGWIVVHDVSDPTAPVEVGRTALTGRAMDVDGQERSPATSRRLVVAAAGPNLVTRGPSNLFLLDGASDSLERVGVVSLTQAMEEGTILRVAVKGRFAYVVTFRTTFGAAVDIVDLVRARELHDAARRTGENVALNIVTPGVGFGQQAIVATIPVRATGSTGFGHLFGIAAGDLLFRGASQTMVLAVGTAPPVAVIDPLAARTVFADAVLQSAEGSVTIGRAVALGILGDRQMAVVVGTGRGRDATGTLTDGPVLAVLDLTDPEQPALISSILLDSLPRDVVLSDDLALVGTEKKVILVGLDDPANPALAGEIAGLGGHLALAEGGVIFGASQDPTTGGLRTAALGSLALIRRISPLFVDLDKDGRTHQPIEIDYELINPPPHLKTAHISLFEGGSEVLQVEVTDLSPGTHSVTVQPGLQLNPTPDQVEIVLIRPDGTESSPYVTRRHLLKSGPTQQPGEAAVQQQQRPVDKASLDGVPESLSPNSAPSESAAIVVSIPSGFLITDDVAVRSADGQWTLFPVTEDAKTLPVFLLPSEFLTTPAFLFIDSTPALSGLTLPFLVFDADLPDLNTAPEIVPLSVRVEPSMPFTSGVITVEGTGFAPGMRIVLGRGATPGFALDTTLVNATTLEASLTTDGLEFVDDLFAAVLSSDGQRLSGPVSIPKDLVRAPPTRSTESLIDISDWTIGDNYTPDDINITGLNFVGPSQIELRGVGLREGLEVQFRTRFRDATIDETRTAMLGSPREVRPTSPLRSEGDAEVAKGASAVVEQEAPVVVPSLPSRLFTAVITGFSRSGQALLRSPQQDYFPSEVTVPLGGRQDFAVYVCEEERRILFVRRKSEKRYILRRSDFENTAAESADVRNRCRLAEGEAEQIVVGQGPGIEEIIWTRTGEPDGQCDRQTPTGITLHRVHLRRNSPDFVTVRGVGLTERGPFLLPVFTDGTPIRTTNVEPPARLTLQTDDSVSLTLRVVADSLGNEAAAATCLGDSEEPVDVDRLVIQIANDFGVPPHFLKAQLVTEAGLCLFNFRYELSTRDLLFYSGDGSRTRTGRSSPERWLKDEPFVHYAIGGWMLNDRTEEESVILHRGNSDNGRGIDFTLGRALKRHSGYHGGSGGIGCIVTNEKPDEVRRSAVKVRSADGTPWTAVRGQRVWQRCMGPNGPGQAEVVPQGEQFVVTDYRTGHIRLGRELQADGQLTVTFEQIEDPDQPQQQPGMSPYLPIPDGTFVFQAPCLPGQVLNSTNAESTEPDTCHGNSAGERPILRPSGVPRYRIGESIGSWLSKNKMESPSGNFLSVTASDRRIEFTGQELDQPLAPRFDFTTAQFWLASSYGALQTLMGEWSPAFSGRIERACELQNRYDIGEQPIFEVLTNDALSLELGSVWHMAERFRLFGTSGTWCKADNDCDEDEWRRRWSSIFRAYNSGGHEYCLGNECTDGPVDENVSRVIERGSACYEPATTEERPECCTNSAVSCPWG